jgi:hypothetical protein
MVTKESIPVLAGVADDIAALVGALPCPFRTDKQHVEPTHLRSQPLRTVNAEPDRHLPGAALTEADYADTEYAITDYTGTEYSGTFSETETEFSSEATWSCMGSSASESSGEYIQPTNVGRSSTKATGPTIHMY